MATIVPVEALVPGTQTALPTEEERSQRMEHYRALAKSVGIESLPFEGHKWPQGQPPVPQRVRLADGGWRDVPPHEWGISMAQCRALMAAARTSEEHLWDPDYSVSQLVRYYIKPWTLHTGVGYSLLANYHEPKEVTVMVSHAWQENAEDFFDTLERSCSETDVMYICFLANYQHNDGYGPNVQQQLGSDPSDSPFFKVLKHIETRGLASRFPSAWRYRRGWDRLPYVCLLAATLLWCPAVIAEGCIPSFSSCEFLHNRDHPWGTWEAKAIGTGYVALLPIAATCACTRFTWRGPCARSQSRLHRRSQVPAVTW
eukprot:TRINITY_DN2841_c0_g2_i3.p1 TRINITY_DN2841_c0_g2~~TRINITY_DN2841_c0_g2_i3.p1  ORF type:complete len:314 (-),score=36.65 TRINITY_DN2841_c0_g2_i3:671-1612(-)